MNGGKGESILTFQNEILSRNEIVLHIITEKIVNSNFLVLTYLQTDKKIKKKHIRGQTKFNSFTAVFIFNAKKFII